MSDRLRTLNLLACKHLPRDVTSTKILWAWLCSATWIPPKGREFCPVSPLTRGHSITIIPSPCNRILPLIHSLPSSLAHPSHNPLIPPLQPQLQPLSLRLEGSLQLLPQQRLRNSRQRPAKHLSTLIPHPPAPQVRQSLPPLRRNKRIGICLPRQTP